MIWGPEDVVRQLAAKQKNLTFDDEISAYYFTDANLDPNSLDGKLIEHDWLLMQKKKSNFRF